MRRDLILGCILLKSGLIFFARRDNSLSVRLTCRALTCKTKSGRILNINQSGSAPSGSGTRLNYNITEKTVDVKPANIYHWAPGGMHSNVAYCEGSSDQAKFCDVLYNS